MRPLFIFGTLQHRPLLEAVLGVCDHIKAANAELRDHSVYAVREGPFPMILKEAGATARGLLLTGLRQDDFDLLDFYEGAFDYRLKDVLLSDGTAACAYFPPDGHWTAEGSWHVSDWANEWGELSTIAAREVMSYRGTKSPKELTFMLPMIRARAWSRINARSSRHGVLTFQGSVDLETQRRPYSHYFALEEYDLTHERFDGGRTPSMMRAVFRAPDATLVLPYDPVRDSVLLVEQLRMGPLARGDSFLWQLEPIAGRLDPGEGPERAARREALEEARLELGELVPVAETYCSPGNSSEFYYIYVGIADLPDQAAGLGGLEDEHEDIRSHVLGFDALMELCDTRQVANAPLVMAAYWLARHRVALRAQAGAG